MTARASALFLAAMVMVSGCGFVPLHSEGGTLPQAEILAQTANPPTRALALALRGEFGARARAAQPSLPPWQLSLRATGEARTAIGRGAGAAGERDYVLEATATLRPPEGAGRAPLSARASAHYILLARGFADNASLTAARERAAARAAEDLATRISVLIRVYTEHYQTSEVNIWDVNESWEEDGTDDQR